jgi:hypothetical protein
MTKKQFVIDRLQSRNETSRGQRHEIIDWRLREEYRRYQIMALTIWARRHIYGASKARRMVSEILLLADRMIGNRYIIKTVGETVVRQPWMKIKCVQELFDRRDQVWFDMHFRMTPGQLAKMAFVLGFSPEESIYHPGTEFDVGHRHYIGGVAILLIVYLRLKAKETDLSEIGAILGFDASNVSRAFAFGVMKIDNEFGHLVHPNRLWRYTPDLASFNDVSHLLPE